MCQLRAIHFIYPAEKFWFFLRKHKDTIDFVNTKRNNQHAFINLHGCFVSGMQRPYKIYFD